MANKLPTFLIEPYCMVLALHCKNIKEGAADDLKTGYARVEYARRDTPRALLHVVGCAARRFGLRGVLI